MSDPVTATPPLPPAQPPAAAPEPEQPPAAPVGLITLGAAGAEVCTDDSCLPQL